MWRRITWEQFARATKFFVAIGWGSAELAFWGARPQALGFIGGMIVTTEAGQVLLYLRRLMAAAKEGTP